ncbi:hypothetical protein FRX31_029619 [Thalictrum thalictroides]|uniref:Uncharacterized protein n=1 Tax=Thalictrum thalictroides TaxID=46969 RepID=A0A7J6V9D2_THATH|nr:hypothetical protein FRX31_029619 [Thalictrum thalictroides]
MDKSSFDSTGAEVDIDLCAFKDVFIEDDVTVNDPLTSEVSPQLFVVSSIDNIQPHSSSKEPSTEVVKETTAVPKESRERKFSASDNEIPPVTSTSSLSSQIPEAPSEPIDKSVEPLGKQNSLNCKSTDSSKAGATPKPAPQRSTMSMSSLAPLFSLALSVLGRNNIVADST